MRAGKLTHKVIIQQRSESKNTIGEDITTYTTYREVWARVVPLTGKEYVAQNETQSSITGKIYIRYLDGVTNDMRVLWGTRNYDIQAVINTEERNRELVLMVDEIL